jgi:hypothetical protein
MAGRLADRLGALLAVLLGIAVLVIGWSLLQRDSGRADVAGDACRALEQDALGTLQLLLPDGWTVERAVVQDAADRTREHDGAPVSFVAAWVRDAAGAYATTEPALYVWEGGTAPRHEALPKSHYLLNDAAAVITRDTTGRGDRADMRRALPDARALRQPYSEDEPAARAAVACLTDGGQPQ